MAVAPDDRSSKPRWEPLADYRFALATALLLLNDRVLKTEWPGLVSGKLSDFVGPVVLATIIAAALGRSRRAVGVGVATTALLMVAIKVSQPVANQLAGLLEWATGSQSRIVADPTDLVGLLALLVVPAVVSAPVAVIDRRWARFIGLTVGLYATVATSAETLDVHDRIGESDGVVTAYTEPYGSSSFDYSALVLRNGEWVEELVQGADELPQGGVAMPYCLRSDDSICVKSDGAFRVLESTDGGESWTDAFSIDDDEGWLSSADFDVVQGSNEGPGEVLELDDGTLIVTMGEIEPIIRNPVGQWSPTDIEFRTFPIIEWLMLAATVLGLGLGGALFIRSRRRSGHVIAGVLTLVFTVPSLLGAALFFVGGASEGLLTGFLLVGGGIGLVLVLVAQLIPWIEGHKTEVGALKSLAITNVAAIIGAFVTMVPLLLWVNGVYGWPIARIGSVVLAVLLTLGVWALARSRVGELKPKPAIPPPVPLGQPPNR